MEFYGVCKYNRLECKIFEEKDEGRGVLAMHITMELYETEIDVLQNFLDTVKIKDEISEKYLILYNFATDCKYAKL